MRGCNHQSIPLLFLKLRGRNEREGRTEREGGRHTESKRDRQGALGLK